MPKWRRLAIAASAALCFSTAHAGIYDEILQAANQGSSEVVIDLLKRGMDVNTADADGTTLLMISARNNNLVLLDFLLKNRANTLKRNKYGDTALMLSSFAGHAEVVRKLLDAGAEPGNSGWAPLHYAAYSGREEILKLLVAHKAPLDARAPNGHTALMLAASLGHLGAVKILIDADADMDMADFEGRTAISLARKNKHEAVVEFLKTSGAEE